MANASSQSVTIFPEVLKSLASSSFSGSYVAVGTPLAFPARILKFTNNSNVDVTISWDGTNDHEFLPADSFLLIDISANRQISNIFGAAKGTQFYVNGASGIGNTGSFYISSYYAS